MNEERLKRHVLLAIAGLNHGGAERVVANLCYYLDPTRFRASVMWHVALGSIGGELRNAGFTVFGFPEVHPTWSRYRRFQFLREVIKSNCIDIVHSHDTATLIDASQGCAFLPGVAHVHTFHYGNYPHLKRRYLWAERLLSRVPDRLVAVGREQRRTIERALHPPAHRIETIYNGVTLPVGSVDSEVVQSFLHGRKGVPVIGSISTLTEQKGLTYLLDTARLLRERGQDCLVLIAGDGPLRPALEQKSRSLGLAESVKFLGWVPGAASRLLPAFDVFVQPSLWEANSMVLLEAMAAARPIVTTDVGESRHVIDDGESGYIVPSRDPSAMAEKLRTLLANDTLRRRLGLTARATFESRYTVRAMIDRYAQLYKDVSELRKPSAAASAESAEGARR